MEKNVHLSWKNTEAYISHDCHQREVGGKSDEQMVVVPVIIHRVCIRVHLRAGFPGIPFIKAKKCE